MSDNEVLIRRLKLLSKSQSAFLKKFVHDKITSFLAVLNEGIELISRHNSDARISSIKNAISSLNIGELDCDVDSLQILMRQELDIIRQSIDGNVVQAQMSVSSTSAPASASSVSSSEDIAKLKALEAENSHLRDLLKEAQNSLAKSTTRAPPPPPVVVAPSIPDQSAELQANLSRLQGQLLQKESDMSSVSKSWEVEKAKVSALQSELAKAKSDISNLEKDLARARREADERLASKTTELTEVANKRVAEAESRLEAEKEEMMDAMAQEVEDIERVKNSQIETIEAEKKKLEATCSRIRNSRQVLSNSVGVVATKSHSISRDYRDLSSQTKRDLNDMRYSLQNQMTDAVMFKLRDMSQQMGIINQRYKKELAERKRLHNLVQELKGNIRVFLRCRPPSSREIEQYGSEAICITFPNPQEVKVFNEKSREKSWEFDEVFGFDCTQEDIYTEVSALVTSVMDGFNVCIFAYGQTGSGKTFTMSGPMENRGVNTRALGDLFAKTSARSGEYRETITVSVLEVYNEDIHDLLADGGSSEKLEVRQGEYGNYVPGLTMVPVSSIQEVFNLLAVADRNRSQTATNMNEHSSRSHMMLTVTLLTESLVNGTITRGKLNLVDLAGSERINKSGATGQALKEAQNINKSLSALGDVIAARVSKQGHVPFRNSTLTYLLQDSLSQDSKTLMIACCSPVLYSAEETFCTLNFASRVRTVELGKASKQTLTSVPTSQSGKAPTGGAARPGAAGGATGATGAKKTSSTPR